MTRPGQVLAARILRELELLDRVAQDVFETWKLAAAEPRVDAFLDSVALNLHGYYVGMEKALEAVAREIDDSLPAGSTWHRDLLEQMALEVPTVRPAVLSESSVLALRALLGFRHFVRNAYSVDLDPELVRRNVDILAEAHPRIIQELRDFAGIAADL